MRELSQAAEVRRPLIDFDQWAQLAKADPEAFEAKRAAFLEEIIRAMPEHRQHRMRCLQWKIDQVRKQCATPMAACMKLNEMMWDSLVGPGGLNEALGRLRGVEHGVPHEARILPFRGRT